ncbi:UNVERIFIED_CONTAM: hypothetical protein Scaly_2201200 [Sesamum calycinum]|uniref:DUF8204 domain-containing protein n=1 Tax=Sesamum calycinum TaxID=2727403 RepID=A0AAW2MR99_9LAMI
MAEERMKGEEEKRIPRAQMAESPNPESIIASVNSKAEDSNQLKQNDRSASPSSLTKNTNPADATSNGNKAKSCKGCLYYSSRFKADSRNPLCVGLTRSLPSGNPNFPCFYRVVDLSNLAYFLWGFAVNAELMFEYLDMVGQSEMEASKEGRNLADFRYACVGYSLYSDQKEHASKGQQTQTELPVCVGLEVLVDRRVNASDSASAPAHIHNKEDGNALPQRRIPKPTNQTGDEFLAGKLLYVPFCNYITILWLSTRFTRNANLVANGVAKNIRKVGNQIKQSLDDILYPYRRRPK